MYEELDDNFTPNAAANKRKKVLIAVICVLTVIILAVSAALLVRAYVVTTFTVDGISMYPTLDGGNGAYMDNDRENGEILYLNRHAKVKRGNLVVFTIDTASGTRNFVKRVIAVGGDRLQIIDNAVYINGALLSEPYINEAMITNDLDITIDSGYIFCMGDNRNHSADSRESEIGQVPIDSVVGKCFLIKGLNGKLRKP